MTDLATLATFVVWLLWIYILVMAVGSVWLLWRVIAHAAAALHRRRTPRIPAPKPLPRNRAIEAQLRRLDAQIEADTRAKFNEIIAHLNDTNTTDH